MSEVTYFVIQPFEISPKGRYKIVAPLQASNKDQAMSRGERVAKQHGGAIVFCRSGDTEFGEFGEAVVLGRFGEVPDDFASL
ncbi:hypothetical protein [Tardiphaga sp. 803_E3_N1_3]|uniref:hypothetical protein n=1 Tax=Tardiphaga sp. 803_E3_N1_3 TaxID=3240785 RepID=UPI003F289112